ncbi:MAG: hypothetical protein ACR2P2_07625, partial [Nakamurella sp.]
MPAMENSELRCGRERGDEIAEVEPAELLVGLGSEEQHALVTVEMSGRQQVLDNRRPIDQRLGI